MAKYKPPKLPFDVGTLETFSNTKTPENVRFPKRANLFILYYQYRRISAIY